MKNIFLTLLIIPMLLVANPGNAEANFVLPDPDVYALNYGDFYSYSLPLLAYFYEQDAGGNLGASANPYDVESTVGAIKNSVVIATGASGTPVNENFEGMDDAYPTPGGNGGASEFDTATTTDPGFTPTMPANNPDTWDATIASLVTYLGGSTPIFFFNNNQANNDGSIAQNLWVYAQIEIWSFQAAAAPLYFELTSHLRDGSGEFGGDPYSYEANIYSDPAFTPQAPTGDPVETDFVLSGGDVCLDNTNAPVDCSSPDVAIGPIPHNLGSDRAAYAVIAPELNDFLLGWNMQDSDYDMFSMEIQMTDLNAGYEQAYIMPAARPAGEEPPPIPEPSTWLLMALGMLILPFARKLRRS